MQGGVLGVQLGGTALIPDTQANTCGGLSSGTPELYKSVAAGSVKLRPWGR